MLAEFLRIAFMSGLASTYGWGEQNCCDPGKACACVYGAITASGEVFDPELATAAIPFPIKTPIRPIDVGMKVGLGPCVSIRINDKMNIRYVGERGFDLSPKALELLTGTRDPRWVGKISKCKPGVNDAQSVYRSGPYAGLVSPRRDMSGRGETLGCRDGREEVFTATGGTFTRWWRRRLLYLPRQDRHGCTYVRTRS